MVEGEWIQIEDAFIFDTLHFCNRSIIAGKYITIKPILHGYNIPFTDCRNIPQ